MKKLSNHVTRRKQYNALHYVLYYADKGRMDAARVWLRRTLALYPLSEHQLHHLRMRFDDIFLSSAGVPALEKRYRGGLN